VSLELNEPRIFQLIAFSFIKLSTAVGVSVPWKSAKQQSVSDFLFENSRGIVDCPVKIGSIRSSDKGQVQVDCVPNVTDMVVRAIEDLSTV
jgi:hypothetical protein